MYFVNISVAFTVSYNSTKIYKRITLFQLTIATVQLHQITHSVTEGNIRYVMKYGMCGAYLLQ